MTFTDLLAGDQIFVDANTFTYHFQPHPVWGPACTQFLQRIENKELTGFTSTHVVAEVAHRLMTLESAVVFGWPIPGIGNRLRTHPGEVQKLAMFRRAIDLIVQSNLQILGIAPVMLATAAALCQQIGLLTNDGLIVTIMQGQCNPRSDTGL